MENEVPKKEETVAEQSETKVEKKSVLDRVKPFVPKLKRKTVIIIVIIVAIVAGASYIAYAKRGWFVAATVNGGSISRLSVIEELERQAGKDVLDTMITKKLIADEAKKLGISVTAEDIDAEVKKAEEQVAAQGSTLEAALAQQGMTDADLREQIVIKKELDQILADRVSVSDVEVDQYIKDNKMAPAKGAVPEALKAQVREQLQSQKFNTTAQSYITDLRAEALIVKYVEY